MKRIPRKEVIDPDKMAKAKRGFAICMDSSGSFQGSDYESIVNAAVDAIRSSRDNDKISAYASLNFSSTTNSTGWTTINDSRLYSTLQQYQGGPTILDYNALEELRDTIEQFDLMLITDGEIANPEGLEKEIEEITDLGGTVNLMVLSPRSDIGYDFKFPVSVTYFPDEKELIKGIKDYSSTVLAD